MKVVSVAKAFIGSEKILKRFFSRFMSNKDDIEDICQETVARALEAEKKSAIQEPKAFLFGVGRNLIRKKLDKESKAIIDFIEDCASITYLTSEDETEQHLETQERMVLFMEAVNTLPSQCRKVFLMKKVEGFSHQEIAQRLHISISTTEKHVASGLRRISAYMDHVSSKKQNQESVPLVSKTKNSAARQHMLNK